MRTAPLRLRAKHPLLRKLSYAFLFVMFGITGVLVAREGVRDNRTDFIVIGIALPFIYAIGEMIYFHKWARKIPLIRCEKCGSRFAMKTLLKVGRCPECQSRRLIGLLPETDDVQDGGAESEMDD